MSPTKEMEKIEQQTLDIVMCLFEDDCSPCLETDSGDSFDPVPIANKLKEVADRMQSDYEFQDVLLQFKKSQEKDINAAFGEAVDSVRLPPAEAPLELHLLNVAVAFCLYVKKKAPELNANIQQATASFLNRRLGQFVADRGGWGAVANL